jgi:hypothetical protein
MRDDKSPLDQVLDLCLFGPIGLLVAARARYPELVEQGRRQLEGHAAIGRFAARYAADKGKHGAGRALAKLRDAQVAGAGAGAGSSDQIAEEPAGSAGFVASTGPAAATDEASSPAPFPHTIAAEEVIAVRHDDDDPTTAASVAADELAIPSYDSLAASQVVPRLDGLTRDELEAVRRYEVAHRARKTVLGKVAQLQRAQP